MTNTNVDAQEIQKFDDIASQWWDSEGPFKPLHQLNPLRLAFIEEHVSLDNKKILDVGCGGGILSESMAKKGAEVTGIDLAENVLSEARSHAKISNLFIDYHCISVENFSENHQEKFDVITCMEMLEHVPDPTSIIKACSRLLKSDGLIFFSTINRNPKSYLYAIIGAEWILQLLPKGTHDYAKFIKPSELDAWCREVKLRFNSIKGIGYHAFSKKYFITDDVSVNYLYCCEK